MPTIEVRNISKAFEDSIAILDISFKLEDGELITLLGPSGSGKTTVLRLIAGLIESDTGEILLNFPHAKKILDLFKKLSIGHSHPDMEAVKYFNTNTCDANDMSHYRTLLAKAVAAITGKAEEKGVESLFHRGGTALSKESFQGMDDFEVVSYLIIPGEANEA